MVFTSCDTIKQKDNLVLLASNIYTGYTDIVIKTNFYAQKLKIMHFHR